MDSMDTDPETTTQAVVVVEGEDSAISTEARASLDPVAKNFVTLLGGKKKFKCVHCDWETVSTSVRRRLEHLLSKGGGNTRPCTHAREKLSEADLAELGTILSTMDQLFEKKRKAKKQAEAATSSLTLPKRQRKLPQFLRKKEKDAIDMAYARKIVMTMVKATYMDSPFTFDFYEKKYGPPPRPSASRHRAARLSPSQRSAKAEPLRAKGKYRPSEQSLGPCQAKKVTKKNQRKYRPSEQSLGP